MPTSSSERECPQCGYQEAVQIYDTRDTSGEVMCKRCGYEEKEEPKFNENRDIVDRKHKILKGFGAMAIGWGVYFLHSKESFLAAKRWLKEQLQSGTIQPKVA